jgi:cytochrome c556
MKALKITLMLAVFCLTVSGSSFNATNSVANETMKEINKKEFKMAGPVKDKTKLPGQNNI